MNQPYSTYAMISSGADTSSARVPELLSVIKDSSTPVSLTGAATYKGQLIGTLKDYQTGDYTQPVVDGTSEIVVKFNKDSATMSGILNSNLVGKIILPEQASLPIEGNGIYAFHVSHLASPITKTEKFANVHGIYKATIAGENASDLVGEVHITTTEPNSPIYSYSGVFGGTKQ